MAEKRRGEAELIAHYFAPLASDKAAFGLSDDAAFLSPPAGYDLVITKDLLVADIHFFANDPAKKIAQKALRVNLSDLAAKGAKPYGYLLGLGLPDNWGDDWLADFVSGLGKDQKEYDFALFGGDTVKSPERLSLSITAFGLVPQGSRIVRPKAEVGDGLYMSGTLGDAALGLLARLGQLPEGGSRGHIAYLQDRYWLPQPRTQLAGILQKYVHAAMDISDGLLGDAAKMAKACGAKAHILADDLPLSEPAKASLKQDNELISTILSGGDDYELLMAVSEENEQAFLNEMSQQPIPVTKVGQLQEGEGFELSSSKWNLSDIESLSFEHF
jgi:thiamine-monophosphate kinase